MTVGPHHGYLATPTSQNQLNFIEANVIPGGASGTANVWIGGKRVWGPEVTTWEWLDGPEKGVVFWNNGPVTDKFAPWDPNHACTGCGAGPDTLKSWSLYLNAWFSPYFTSAWDAANYTGVYAGGNSGFVVEYGAKKCESG